ncbi:MAG TPA: DNA repair protein RadA [Candidatus Eremiobacteraeota bacterium]|nr:DNA repair protein RadA [Candidatus Eremiobacteraeota bacterium]
MSKEKNKKTSFICQECGYSTVKWIGRCPDCGGWSTFQEEMIKKSAFLSPSDLEELLPISNIHPVVEIRFSTGIKELDRVLGGGIVSGSLVIVGGEPGIGKSTLLLQMVNSFGKDFGNVLYVSGEESREQIRLRADRLGSLSSQVFVLSETDLNTIKGYVENLSPRVLIVDSIQTIYHSELISPPGTVSQIRDCTYNLMRLAKASGLIIFLVGHVTKQGAIAGPKLLEHMVDTVLYFEENSQQPYRILRAVKNRFGSTNEVGIFEMTSEGLREVLNPSEVFLSDGMEGYPGTVVFATMEGTRPILVEIQALTGYTTYSQPRRSGNGIDINRLFLILAVLEKRLGLKFGTIDVYVNVVGGMRIEEPAADLAIATAICSSFWNRSVLPKTVVFGEIGLTGEIRNVLHSDRRLFEAYKMGYRRCVLPARFDTTYFKENYEKFILSDVRSVDSALSVLLGVEPVKEI